MEAAAKYIPTKPRAKCRVSWESLEVRKKWDNMKILLDKKNSTCANAWKLQESQSKLTKKEQKEYIQSQVNKIRNSVEDRQSQIVWQTSWEQN